MHTRGEAGEDVGGEEEWGKGQEGEDQLPGERRLARVWVCPMNRRAIKLASRLYNILLVQFRVRTADLRTLFPSKLCFACHGASDLRCTDRTMGSQAKYLVTFVAMTSS
jgi:hypothetical protein